MLPADANRPHSAACCVERKRSMAMTARGWLVAGAVSGALAVMTGAFGAHAL